MNTLLIDDDAFALRLLARQLRQLDLDTLTLCERAQDALDLLGSPGEPIGLVFCDLQMPDLDGVEFVRHLARIGFAGALVLVSGEDPRTLQAAQLLARAHRIRVVAALAKPVTTAHLRQALATLRRGGAAAVADDDIGHSPDELRRAIAGGELVNHYQPKVDLASGRPVGVEALVRWRHPTAGLRLPDRFIATAEEHGLIDALTGQVLGAALAQLRRWRDAGLDLQVAVNVSMDNLTALDFPDVVARAASRAGVGLGSLMLEVTESRLMRDRRAPLDVLTRLRLKRVKLSIDDFGTGHSSLAQLRDIPFDEIKLDRSFVDGAAGDPALAAIVEGVLAMAHQLGIGSVAEGVRTRADWDYLRRRGCGVAQGFFIARPMPGGELPAWCADWDLRRTALIDARH